MAELLHILLGNVKKEERKGVIMEKREQTKRQEDMELIQSVDEQRVTLIDDQDTEYEFIIVDDFECDGKNYYALVSCDEKVEKGSAAGGSEGDEITVVRVEQQEKDKFFFAVSDADELYKVAKIIEEKFGHLSEC